MPKWRVVKGTKENRGLWIITRAGNTWDEDLLVLSPIMARHTVKFLNQTKFNPPDFLDELKKDIKKDS